MVLNKKVGLFDNADDDEEDVEQVADLPHHGSEVSDVGGKLFAGHPALHLCELALLHILCILLAHL